jgi:hypothetical protein
MQSYGGHTGHTPREGKRTDGGKAPGPWTRRYQMFARRQAAAEGKDDVMGNLPAR